MEDAAAAEAAHQESNSIKSPSKSLKSPSLSAKSSSNKSPKSRTGVEETIVEQERFSGLSCLLITWKTNPEVENFKELYTDKGRRSLAGDLVSEQSLSRNYRIIGKVRSKYLRCSNITLITG